MTIDERLAFLLQSTESLHASAQELHASMSELRTSTADLRATASEHTKQLQVVAENIRSLGEY